MKNKQIQNKLGILFVVLSVLVLCLPIVFAIPAPTGIAAQVSGDGATNANVVVIAFEEGTSYELDTIITTTNDLGQFAGALTTDLAARMDVYITVVSSDPENQLEVTLGGLSAGDDQLLYLEMPVVESDSGDGESSGGGSDGGSNNVNIPETQQKPAEEEVDSFPPIEDEYESEFNEIIDLIENDGEDNLGGGDLIEPEEQLPETIEDPWQKLKSLLPGNTVPIIISTLLIVMLILILWLVTKRDRDDDEENQNRKKLMRSKRSK